MTKSPDRGTRQMGVLERLVVPPFTLMRMATATSLQETFLFLFCIAGGSLRFDVLRPDLFRDRNELRYRHRAALVARV